MSPRAVIAPRSRVFASVNVTSRALVTVTVSIKSLPAFSKISELDPASSTAAPSTRMSVPTACSTLPPARAISALPPAPTTVSPKVKAPSEVTASCVAIVPPKLSASLSRSVTVSAAEIVTAPTKSLLTLSSVTDWPVAVICVVSSTLRMPVELTAPVEVRFKPAPTDTSPSTAPMLSKISAPPIVLVPRVSAPSASISAAPLTVAFNSSAWVLWSARLPASRTVTVPAKA